MPETQRRSLSSRDNYYDYYNGCGLLVVSVYIVCACVWCMCCCMLCACNLVVPIAVVHVQ